MISNELPYFGEVSVDMERHGRGISEGRRGEICIGYWEDNEIQEGSVYTKDGSVYHGGFLKGARHGHGTMENNEGTKYVGNFDNNKLHGHGDMMYANGNRYVGDWKYDKPNG